MKHVARPGATVAFYVWVIRRRAKFLRLLERHSTDAKAELPRTGVFPSARRTG